MEAYNVQTAKEKNEIYNFDEMQEMYDNLNKNIQEQEILKQLNYISDIRRLNERQEQLSHWTMLSSNSSNVNPHYYSK